MSIKGTVVERGNGFPSVGDYVYGGDGEVYQVVRLSGYIDTTRADGNSVGAVVEEADWDDVCPDGGDPPAMAYFDTDSDDDSDDGWLA